MSPEISADIVSTSLDALVFTTAIFFGLWKRNSAMSNHAFSVGMVFYFLRSLNYFGFPYIGAACSIAIYIGGVRLMSVSDRPTSVMYCILGCLIFSTLLFDLSSMSGAFQK